MRRRAGIIVSDWRASCDLPDGLDTARVIEVLADALSRCAGSRRSGHVHHGVTELFAGAVDDLRPLDPTAITCLREVTRRQVLLGLPPREAITALLCMSTVLDELLRQITEWSAAGLKALAYLDGLTGLANRRAADDGLRAAVSGAVRHGRPLAVVVIDLDHLKQINDRLGHPAGDRALCLLADALRAALRDEDLAYRTGGDEFLVLLPETTLADVDAAMRRVAAAGAPPFSYGASVASVEADDADALLRLADHRLFASRRAARDATARTTTSAGRRGTAVVSLGAITLSMVLAAHLTRAGDARRQLTMALAGAVAAALSFAVVRGPWRRAGSALMDVLGSSMVGFAAATVALVIAQAAYAPHGAGDGRTPTTMTARSAGATRTEAPPRAAGTHRAVTAQPGPVSRPWPPALSTPPGTTATATATSRPAATTSTPSSTTSSTTSSTSTTNSTNPPASVPTTRVNARDDNVLTTAPTTDVDVLFNDDGGPTDLDRSTLQIAVDPSVGRARVVRGVVRYSTDRASVGRFQYRICAEDGRCGVAWVTVTYDPGSGDDAPPS